MSMEPSPWNINHELRRLMSEHPEYDPETKLNGPVPTLEVLLFTFTIIDEWHPLKLNFIVEEPKHRFDRTALSEIDVKYELKDLDLKPIRDYVFMSAKTVNKLRDPEHQKKLIEATVTRQLWHPEILTVDWTVNMSQIEHAYYMYGEVNRDYSTYLWFKDPKHTLYFKLKWGGHA